MLVGKHIDENFMKDFVARVRKSKEGVFAVGEFWKDRSGEHRRF